MKSDLQIQSAPGEKWWQRAAHDHQNLASTLVWMTFTVLENRKCQAFLRMSWQSFQGISGDDSFGFWDYHEHEPVGISIPSRMIGKMGFDEYTGCEN
jgi:hypothetical protein